MAIRSRTELKSFFVRNAIPTEENFADLIDSGLSLADDGVRRTTGEPLRIDAVTEGQKRALALYPDSNATTPDWLVSLNPPTSPEHPDTSRLGFGIASGDGKARLFVDPEGRVGIGTNRPTSLLHVEGDLRVEGDINGRNLVTDGKNWDDHRASHSNPHRVTAVQVGALPLTGGQLTGPLTTAVHSTGTYGVVAQHLRVGGAGSKTAMRAVVSGDLGDKHGLSIQVSGDHDTKKGVSLSVRGIRGEKLGIESIVEGTYGLKNAIIARVSGRSDRGHAIWAEAEPATDGQGDRWRFAAYFKGKVAVSGSMGIGTEVPGQDKLDVRGRCYASGGWHTRNGDYAELFESHDGRPIAAGVSVVITDDGKIRAAERDSVPIGIVSAAPAVLGGSHKEWPKKYLSDDFGRPYLEEHEEEMTPERGLPAPEIDVRKALDDPHTERRSGDAGTQEIRQGEGPPMVGSGQLVKKQRPRLNPEYDPHRTYVPREERPEWNAVGLLGQLPLRRGQPVAPTWVKIRNIGLEVELWLVK